MKKLPRSNTPVEMLPNGAVLRCSGQLDVTTRHKSSASASAFAAAAAADVGGGGWRLTAVNRLLEWELFPRGPGGRFSLKFCGCQWWLRWCLLSESESWMADCRTATMTFGRPKSRGPPGVRTSLKGSGRLCLQSRRIWSADTRCDDVCSRARAFLHE